ncbi:hypothetical protein GGI25_000133 [Coemansia spiralis]|uniref:L-threonine 3-dehydrogenase, mitochondrial n=2 Tax=Coemansia TaxID=4863 RepID=A0A9W8L1R2_9FUNG|nr:hypothetical protein BX070DRAFT_231921 [Coemansia spiralis]KAJ1992462.1 hypothetical protein EDC05_002779 [Coemansia umbellata]KAJ2621791.1 hypothetical protein GGI26_003771 [Coemansia sp. RSA 1358]KAJ2681178.1 hypothetical protein GGI25_000133 [Coemansia spiralis]
MLLHKTTRTFSRLNLARQLSTSTSSHRPPRVLVTGSLGQLGSTMVSALRSRFGSENVIASDIKKPTVDQRNAGPFVFADVLNYRSLEQITVDYGIDWVVHFSAVLSAAGERNPTLGLSVNVNGFQNVLELAKNHRLRLLSPSTMGAFGPTTPKDATPDLTIMRPNTIYGISKVHMELMGEYYTEKYGVDFRSLRYPGIISADTPPGGGTTDYAIDIFHGALKHNSYTCFLKAETRLPMAYIDDCIRGTMQLLEAPEHSLSQRVYNVHACDFTPAELAEEIRHQHSESFTINYQPDSRQVIADTWPRTMADDAARSDWGWNPVIGTPEMTRIMLEKLRPMYQNTALDHDVSAAEPAAINTESAAPAAAVLAH